MSTPTDAELLARITLLQSPAYRKISRIHTDNLAELLRLARDRHLDLHTHPVTHPVTEADSSHP